MKVIVRHDKEEAEKVVADLIAGEVRTNPEIVMSLPTGSTPVGVFSELTRMHEEEGLDFSSVTCFNMDEYVGLGRDHAQSYYRFLRENLYERVGMSLENTFSPDACAANLGRAADDYSSLIKRAGGFDLTFLGIGRDGHISFNMPSDALHPLTHVERLSEAAVRDNARFFEDVSEVPTQAITIGMRNILESRRIVLLALGEAKAPVVARWLGSGLVTTWLPASFLWLHPDVTVVLDQGAASELR